MTSRLGLALVASPLLFVVGCSFPTENYKLAPPDAAVRDSSIIDVSNSDIQTQDVSPRDTQTQDVSPSDTQTQDVSMADGSPADTPAVDVPPVACDDQHPCAAGQACCSGVCLDIQSSSAHCGACGTVCPSGQACCAGACTPTGSDPSHCGACNTVCDYPNGTPVCTAGACASGTCDPGFGDCDGDLSDGCETELSSSAAHCGACNRACASGPGATAACIMGACTLQCSVGRGNCDGNAANGCETELNSPTHCGACGQNCPTAANSTAVCLSGLCGTTCNPGFADCDGNPANGCEIDTRSNATNCGACGTNCSRPSANTACVSGACVLQSCVSGRGNCDGNAANGCETDLTASAANCTACGVVCPAPRICSNGCGFSCSGGQTLCGMNCITTATDPLNCGGCGRNCVLPHATAGCSSGACTVAHCDSGWADCDNMASNGCEENIGTDVGNCGGCRLTCSAVNGTANCAAGVCGVTCASGFANCDGDMANGCELQTSNNVTNCGACGTVCSVPHASAGCANGSCTVGRCESGWSNCNALVTDGCEANLAADESNCGTCGRRCLFGMVCNNGVCGMGCGRGYTLCSGACRNLQTDELNCGACGRLCLRGTTCVLGRCAVIPPANDTCSGATVIDLSAGSRVNLTGTLLNSRRDLTPSCGALPTGDVFYQFTLSRPEYVYADTFGSTADTKLQLTSSCTTGSITTRSSYSLVCNDDRGRGCSGGTTGAQVYAALGPGTYYLVVGGQNGTGSFALHFEHVPAGNGTTNWLNPGTYSLNGTTSTTSSTSTTCGGAGGEATWWWATCPEAPAGPFSASSCLGSNFDIVLGLTNGSGSNNVCNTTPQGFPCSLNSARVSGTVPLGAGLHVFQIDGFGAGTTGTYAVSVTRP